MYEKDFVIKNKWMLFIPSKQKQVAYYCVDILGHEYAIILFIT